MRVACAAEGRYVRYSAAMLHSVLPARVEYLHSPRLRYADRRRLEATVTRGGGTIAFHEIDDRNVADFPARHRFTPAMWYRLFLPELLPDIDRVLYLDADTLAVDSLAPLWEIDLGEHWVGAVTNVFEEWALGRPAELGLAGPERYFNSGVLVLNLEQMRRDGRGPALREFVRERELLWPDQDALNVVLGERRLELHPRWNCMNSVLAFPQAVEVFGARAVEEARENPGIRHFEGPDANKPWHLLCEAPGRERWREHSRATPWRWRPPEGITLRNLARQGLTAIRPV